MNRTPSEIPAESRGQDQDTTLFLMLDAAEARTKAFSFCELSEAASAESELKTRGRRTTRGEDESSGQRAISTSAKRYEVSETTK